MRISDDLVHTYISVDGIGHHSYKSIYQYNYVVSSDTNKFVTMIDIKSAAISHIHNYLYGDILDLLVEINASFHKIIPEFPRDDYYDTEIKLTKLMKLIESKK